MAPIFFVYLLNCSSPSAFSLIQSRAALVAAPLAKEEPPWQQEWRRRPRVSSELSDRSRPFLANSWKGRYEAIYCFRSKFTTLL